MTGHRCHFVPGHTWSYAFGHTWSYAFGEEYLFRHTRSQGRVRSQDRVWPGVIGHDRHPVVVNIGLGVLALTLL